MTGTKAANNDEYILLTPAKVCEMLTVSADTLKEWRDKGIGPRHVKLVGGIRYRLSDLKSYIDENTRASTHG